MLVIRFFRTGKKNQPFFKIVVTEKTRPPRGGRFVEELGFYNPLTKEKNVKKDRVKYWISVGAQPSDTVYNLLVKEGIIEGKKIALHKKKKVKEKKDPSVAPTSADSISVAEATSAKGAAPADEKAMEGKEVAPAPAVPSAATEEKPAEKPAEAPKEPAEKSAEARPPEAEKPMEEKVKEKPTEKPKEEPKEEQKPEPPVAKAMEGKEKPAREFNKLTQN